MKVNFRHWNMTWLCSFSSSHILFWFLIMSRLWKGLEDTLMQFCRSAVHLSYLFSKVMLSQSYAVREFVLFIVQKVIIFYVYFNTVGFLFTRELIRLLTTWSVKDGSTVVFFSHFECMQIIFCQMLHMQILLFIRGCLWAPSCSFRVLFVSAGGKCFIAAAQISKQDWGIPSKIFSKNHQNRTNNLDWI